MLRPDKLDIPRRPQSVIRRRKFSHQVVRNGVWAAVLGALHLSSDQSVGHPAQHGYRGRRKGSQNIDRGVCTWLEDYLSPNPIYNRSQFRSLFRVPRALFEKLHADLLRHAPDIWATRINAAKKKGIDSRIKVLVCLKILGSGRANNDKEDGAKMGSETARVYFKKFCQHIVQLYGPTFLNRHPNPEEITVIERNYNASGFPGCVGAVNCCHVAWKNCPFSRRVENAPSNHAKTRRSRMATMSVQAWSDQELYIWNWFNTCTLSNTKSSLLPVSPLFRNILDGSFHFRLPYAYQIKPDGERRKIPYFLVNHDFPSWPIFAKPIKNPSSDNDQVYNSRHNGVFQTGSRTAMGVLKSRFKFMQRECFLWYLDDVIAGCNTCVILHNMLVRMTNDGSFYEDEGEHAKGINIITEFFSKEETDMLLDLDNAASAPDSSPAEVSQPFSTAATTASSLGLRSIPDFHGLRADLIHSLASGGDDAQKT